VINLVGWIVLAALVVDHVVGVFATLLNLRALDAHLPDEFADTYDQSEYERSQLYTRAKSRLGLFSDTLGLIVLIAFWFSGGFEFVDRLVRETGFGEVATGVLFIFALLFGQSLLELPFMLFRTFVMEKRFDFNKTTATTFLIDRIKGIALALILGAPLLAVILAFFLYAGSFAWLYCWMLVVLFSLAMQYLAPTLIMPLFNKFEPLEPGELRDAIIGYASHASFPLRNVFVMDGSKRSTKSNAFFTGFGRNKRVVLFDTLIKQHGVEEIVAIVAHEIGHYRKRHIMQGIAVSIVHSGVMLFLLSLALSSPALYEAFFVTQQSIYAGLVFFGLLFSPVEMLLSIAMNALSRHNEFEADRFAADTTEAPGSLVAALKRLSTVNLANLTPHPLYVSLYYSHPPVTERIRALKLQTYTIY